MIRSHWSMYAKGDIWCIFFYWSVIDIQYPIFWCDWFQFIVICYFYPLENDPSDKTSCYPSSHKFMTLSSLCCTLHPMTVMLYLEGCRASSPHLILPAPQFLPYVWYPWFLACPSASASVSVSQIPHADTVVQDLSILHDSAWCPQGPSMLSHTARFPF